MGLLVLLFIVVPVAEIYVMAQVAGEIGWLSTLGLIIAVSVIGAWLVKYQGLGVLGRAEQRVQRGELPGKELVDGILILFAGALLLTPGFLTDAVGVLLLLPPVRALLRGRVLRRYRVRLARGTAGARGFSARWVGGDFIEGEVVDEGEDGGPEYGRRSIDRGDDTA
jgi:UPF0716 protein FxsA